MEIHLSFETIPNFFALQRKNRESGKLVKNPPVITHLSYNFRSLDVLLRKIGKEMFSYPASIKLIIYKHYNYIFTPFNFYIITAAKWDLKLCFLRLIFAWITRNICAEQKLKPLKLY